MNRFYVFLIIVLAVIQGTALAMPPVSQPEPVAIPLLYDIDRRIDVSNIEMVVTNFGSFARWIANNGDAGLWFPRGTNKRAVYAAGLWMGGLLDNTQLAVNVAEYSYEYVPGQIYGCQNGSLSYVDGTSLPQYKVYKINRGDTTSDDYLNWPFEQGAPYVDTNGNGRYDAGEPPRVYGDQTLFSVYHDANPAAHVNNAGGPPPMGVEIQHTTFGFNSQDQLGNILFLSYKLVNKGCYTINDTYVSIWGDPDLGGSVDDLIGCDPAAGLGYCYNGTNNDNTYGNRPPAIGFDFLQGPLVPSANPNDTVVLPDGRTFLGMALQNMNAFQMYVNGTDPRTPEDSYFRMQGLEFDGTPITNPYTGEVTTFMFGGDPVTGTGWLDSNPGDRRLMPSSGPFDLPPWQDLDNDNEAELGEPGVQEIVAAIVIGQGGDRLSSITMMRGVDEFAQILYENNYEAPARPPQPELTAIPGDAAITLSWDNSAEIPFGDFMFEGYNVYQLSNTLIPIATFDVVNGVTIIEQDGEIVQHGTDSGLQHALTITHDYATGLPLINTRPYSFAVTAYFYNPDSFVHAVESWPLLVTATPVGSYNGFSFSVDHLSGESLGFVDPFLVDPAALTGHDYELTFTETDTAIVWNLRDAYLNQFVLTGQPSGILPDDEDSYEFPVVDGFMLRVVGPPPGIKRGDALDYPDNPELWGWDVPTGTRRFTWASADGLGFEGFRGAMGWVSPSQYFSGLPPAVPASNLKKVLLKFASVPDGNVIYNPVFNLNDENMSYAYRYGRWFARPPAYPMFAPYIVNAVDGYSYQDYTKSVPLSAWNIEDSNNPQRLAVGFLENNTVQVHDENGNVVIPGGGLVDGKYWPGHHTFYDNTATTGSREWLFIFDMPYTVSAPNPALQVEITENSVPIMYWATVNRRGAAPFSPGGSGEDQFVIIHSNPFLADDVYTFTGTTGIEDNETNGSGVFSLAQNYPNPFNPITQIRYYLPSKTSVEVAIYNITGQRVKTLLKAEQPAGEQRLFWDGRNDAGQPVSSGMYFYSVTAGERHLTKKMVLLK